MARPAICGVGGDRHHVLQGERRDSLHFSSLEARLGPASRLSSRLLATSARIGRHEVDVDLTGEGADVDGVRAVLPSR
jgi:hypothetical protein